MQPLAEPVTQLIDAFCKLPGIGPKTATRLAYFLLRSDETVALNLASALETLKARTVFCRECHNIADSDPCPICSNAQRDHSLICVVEEPLDVQAIERTREYNGVYHVLHGAISPVEGVGPEQLKIGELLQRIQRSQAPGNAPDDGIHAAPVVELLLATNPNLEGEATSMYIARLTKPLGVRVTRLARGLPMGGDLEYADEVTLGRALTGRSEMQGENGMIQTYEAIISENGDVELLEPVKLARARRALVTVLEDVPVSNQQRPPNELLTISIPVGKDESTENNRRPYGLAAGQFIVPDDFDAPLPEEMLREFEGS